MCIIVHLLYEACGSRRLLKVHLDPDAHNGSHKMLQAHVHNKSYVEDYTLDDLKLLATDETQMENQTTKKPGDRTAARVVEATKGVSAANTWRAHWMKFRYLRKRRASRNSKKAAKRAMKAVSSKVKQQSSRAWRTFSRAKVSNKLKQAQGRAIIAQAQTKMEQARIVRCTAARAACRRVKRAWEKREGTLAAVAWRQAYWREATARRRKAVQRANRAMRSAKNKARSPTAKIAFRKAVQAFRQNNRGLRNEVGLYKNAKNTAWKNYKRAQAFQCAGPRAKLCKTFSAAVREYIQAKKIWR